MNGLQCLQSDLITDSVSSYSLFLLLALCFLQKCGWIAKPS